MGYGTSCIVALFLGHPNCMTCTDGQAFCECRLFYTYGKCLARSGNLSFMETVCLRLNHLESSYNFKLAASNVQICERNFGWGVPLSQGPLRIRLKRPGLSFPGSAMAPNKKPKQKRRKEKKVGTNPIGNWQIPSSNYPSVGGWKICFRSKWLVVRVYVNSLEAILVLIPIQTG